MVDARLAGQVVARNDRTVVIEGTHYSPLDDVDQRFVRLTYRQSLCPWKGIASYDDVDVDGARSRRAGWTYRHPSPFARRIKNYVAFWGGAQVREVDEDVDASASGD